MSNIYSKQQTCSATLYTYINNILPRIIKLEATILQLQQKITTEQDTVQINAPDFDLDIDGPNTPRTHNNTVVVSVQDHLNSPEPKVSDATDSQEDNTTRDPPDFINNNSEKFHRYDDFPTISPRTFKAIQQNRTKSLQDTVLIQKKYLC